MVMSHRGRSKPEVAVSRRCIVGVVALACLASAPRSARAELPQTFDVPAVNDDYRVNYGLTQAEDAAYGTLSTGAYVPADG